MQTKTEKAPSADMIASLAKAVEAAAETYEARRSEELAARRAACDALNDLNMKQEVLDKAVEAFRSGVGVGNWSMREMARVHQP